MPVYNFKCPTHGEQERFKCEVGQLSIKCNECDKKATREAKPHRASFVCEGGYDSGFQSK